MSGKLTFVPIALALSGKMKITRWHQQRADLSEFALSSRPLRPSSDAREGGSKETTLIYIIS